MEEKTIEPIDTFFIAFDEHFRRNEIWTIIMFVKYEYYHHISFHA